MINYYIEVIFKMTETVWYASDKIACRIKLYSHWKQ